MEILQSSGTGVMNCDGKLLIWWPDSGSPEQLSDHHHAPVRLAPEVVATLHAPGAWSALPV